MKVYAEIIIVIIFEFENIIDEYINIMNNNSFDKI
jgi:hypothetical protein